MYVLEQASYAEVNANWTRDVWGGNATLEPNQMFPQLLKEKLPGADKITYEEFKHIASLVGPSTGSHTLCTETAGSDAERLSLCADRHIQLCVPQQRGAVSAGDAALV